MTDQMGAVSARAAAVGSADRRRRRDRGRLVAAVALLVVVGATCGGSGEPEAVNTTVGSEPSTAPADGAVDEPGDPPATAGEVVVTADGHELSYLGWTDWPFPGVDLEPSHQLMRAYAEGTRIVAIRVSVCAGADSAPISGHFLFTVADADGQPFGSDVEHFEKVGLPVVSDELLTWPEPGTCDEGWLQPRIPVDAVPTIVLWQNLFANEAEEYQWFIGEPGLPADLE